MANFFTHMPMYENANRITCNISNTTSSINVFTITGPVIIWKLFLVITTAIGTNHTAGGFRLESGAGVTNVTTLAATLSNGIVGGCFYRNGTTGSALTGTATRSAASVNLNEVGMQFVPFVCHQPSAASSMKLAYRYTTTNTPSSGVIEVHVSWSPMLPTSTLVNV